MLHRLAAGRRRAVVIGVHEGSSSLVLVAALPQGADLHLVDPFAEGATGGSRPTSAVKALVGRAASGAGARCSTGTWGPPSPSPAAGAPRSTWWSSTVTIPVRMPA